MKARVIAILQCIAMFFKNLRLKVQQLGERKIPVVVVMKEPTSPIINLGDTAINPEWRWIKVANPKGRPNGNGFHNFGDSAGIKAGAKLAVVAIDGESVLVSYESPQGQGYGSEAGNGTIFFLPAQTFANMTQTYTLLQEQTEARKARVRELLKQASAQVAEPTPPTTTES